ncbi:Alpha/Beta hydrolase protein [Hyaloraphidium curvatum]|nr:Alpha/Beta hydrolase protein [Hyaloraphidium curvatum]
MAAAAKTALIALVLIGPTVARVVGRRALAAIGLLSTDPRISTWSTGRELLETFARSVLYWGAILAPHPATAKVRARIAGGAAPKLPDGLTYSTVKIPRRAFPDDPISGDADPVEAEIIAPADGKAPAEQKAFILWHGGGYVIGDPTQIRGSAIALASKGFYCLAPTYRLAPAERFPGALHDGASAYLWLLEQGFKPSNVFFGGMSAGGNMSFATAFFVIREGHPAPAGVTGFTPWLDLSASTPASRVIDLCPLPGAVVAGVHPSSVVGDKEYVSPYADNLVDPAVSPLYADPTELAKLPFPPCWMQTGAIDRLRDDSTLFYLRAAGAGIPAELEIYEGATHLFAGMAFLPAVRILHERLAAWADGVLEGKKPKTAYFVKADGEAGPLSEDDLRGMLKDGLKDYEGHAGRERIEAGWKKNGFLEVWRSAVPGSI